jgi:Na+/melibiose symporter-like transporter
VNFIRWFSTPNNDINPKNFVNVQIDAIGVGLASAAAPFLPVFLTRLDATPLQVGLLTTMPAVTGFLLAIPLGRLLQKQKNIIPWFSTARLLVLMSYALTGLVTFFVAPQNLVLAILLVWALATIPQTLLSIAFSVVMNSVAGPAGRFELMSRRWSILGATTALTIFLIGQMLDRVPFPLNFQIMFMALSLGGLVSFYFSSKLDLSNLAPPHNNPKQSVAESLRNYLALIRAEKPFVSFITKRFVYMTGVTLATPLFPLFFVRELGASDGWIANINTAQTAILIVGYFFWSRMSRARGARKILLITTFGLSLYPAAIAVTDAVWPVAIYAGIAGVFQAGLNLVFFDELMKTVPVQFSATFVSFAQSIEYMAMIYSPLLASLLAEVIGLSGALLISGAIRLLGFALFYFPDRRHTG